MAVKVAGCPWLHAETHGWPVATWPKFCARISLPAV